MRRASSLFAACAAVAVAATAAVPQSRAQEKAPDVTANGDGSCIYHKSIGGGTKQDIPIANGATYHQAEQKGRKSGIVYVPDRTWSCQNGHFIRQ